MFNARRWWGLNDGFGSFFRAAFLKALIVWEAIEKVGGFYQSI